MVMVVVFVCWRRNGVDGAPMSGFDDGGEGGRRGMANGGWPAQGRLPMRRRPSLV